MSYVFDIEKLRSTLQGDAEHFSAAEPFPHIVIDGFLRKAAAQELAEVFPGPDDAQAWDLFGAHGYEVKRGTSDETHFPEPLRHAIHQLNSGPFVAYLEALTGIDHLLPDPHLVGGGLHLSRQGDHLGIHADFNWHQRLQAHRRLNLLIYLTPQTWQESCGGALELWRTDASEKFCTIAPDFNRAVLFVTRSDTFHGHPEPWAAPAGVFRKSIAMYYYTSNRPANEVRPEHSTLYKGYHVP